MSASTTAMTPPASVSSPVFWKRLWRTSGIQFVVFFIIAIIAAIFGFSGLAVGAAGIAKVLFVIFLIGAVVSLLFGRRAPI